MTGRNHTRRRMARPKRHRNYTTFEYARIAGVHRNTVRRWIRDGKLPAIRDRKVMLILGANAVEFERKRRLDRRRPCKIDELFCFRCQAPRRPASGAVEYRATNAKFGTIRGRCCQCSTVMNKGFSASRLPELRTLVDVTVVSGAGTLGD